MSLVLKIMEKVLEFQNLSVIINFHNGFIRLELSERIYVLV